jgi:hypothetical protein
MGPKKGRLMPEEQMKQFFKMKKKVPKSIRKRFGTRPNRSAIVGECYGALKVFELEI